MMKPALQACRYTDTKYETVFVNVTGKMNSRFLWITLYFIKGSLCNRQRTSQTDKL